MAEEVAAARDRRIVVAVDESVESMYALTWYLKNVVSPNDTIFLVHAKTPPTPYTAIDGTGYLFSSELVANMERYEKQVAESVMEKAVKICRDQAGGVKVETIVASGDARDVICNMVEKLGGDILVIGSHGYGLIKRTFLGSVSNHCVHHVKCPVMVVKKPKSGEIN